MRPARTNFQFPARSEISVDVSVHILLHSFTFQSLDIKSINENWNWNRKNNNGGHDCEPWEPHEQSKTAFWATRLELVINQH